MVVVLLYELVHLSLSLECLLLLVLSSLSPMYMEANEKEYATFSLATALFLGCWLYCSLFNPSNYFKNSCNFYYTFLVHIFLQMAFKKMKVEPISKLQLQIVRFLSWYYEETKVPLKIALNSWSLLYVMINEIGAIQLLHLNLRMVSNSPRSQSFFHHTLLLFNF